MAGYAISSSGTRSVTATTGLAFQVLKPWATRTPAITNCTTTMLSHMILSHRDLRKARYFNPWILCFKRMRKGHSKLLITLGTLYGTLYLPSLRYSWTWSSSCGQKGPLKLGLLMKELILTCRAAFLSDVRVMVLGSSSAIPRGRDPGEWIQILWRM